jgi:hypothetical protein
MLVLALVAVGATFVVGLVSAVERRSKPLWLTVLWSAAALIAPIAVLMALSPA